MGLFDLALALLVLAFSGVYFASYRLLRGLLGEKPGEEIPWARAVRGRKLRGYRQEPSWVRPLQALVLATGVTLSLVVVLGILAVASAMLLV